MLRSLKLTLLGAGLLVAALSAAQTPVPAGAPAGSTGLCKDGTYWTGATKRGACHGHKGVQDWYAPSAAATATAAPAPAPAPAAAAPPAAPAAPVAPAAPTAPKAAAAPAAAAAPGGGPGLVWVNTPTKVYHCPSDRWYGKTKTGAYMSESDAIAQGNHADHGKACAK
jgi:hypothetical protein